MKYAIKITEMLTRTVIVEAEDVLSAIDTVTDEYNHGRIVLTADNSGVEVEVEDDTENYNKYFGKDVFDKMECNI